MLICVVKEICTGVWVDVKTWGGARLGGVEVVVKVTDGIKVYVGRKVEVGFTGKFLVTGLRVGVEMGGGMKTRHANRMRIIGSKTRNRILEFINDNKTAWSS